jgi:TRAP-type C4-dicarboxylate transport system permease small subunit
MASVGRYVERVFIFVGGLALLAMMLHVTADVAFKYLFNSPVPLTMEMVTYYYMAAVVFLPLFSLERKDATLVHVELVYGLLAMRVRRVILPAALLLSAIFCACAAYAAWKPAMQAFHTGTYAGSILIVSIWPTRFLPVIGFALLAATLTIKAFNVIRRGIHDEDEKDSSEPSPQEGTT